MLITSDVSHVRGPSLGEEILAESGGSLATAASCFKGTKLMTDGPSMIESQHGIVLFDGVCNLCNGFVNFVIDRDPDGYFKFGALQSKAAQPYLARFRLRPDYLESIVLIENGRCYRDSTAALRILRRLKGPWPLFYGLIVIPRPLRDAVYRWIARHRYRWFGRRAQCRVPTPDLLARFLEPTSAVSSETQQKSPAV